MKYIAYSLLFLIASCAGKSARDISGTYVRFAEGEFSKSWDTLVVDDCGESDTYTVQQYTGFQKIREKKLQPKELRKAAQVTVVLDESKDQLLDRRTGLVYSFPAEGKMLAGNAEYVKIK